MTVLNKISILSLASVLALGAAVYANAAPVENKKTVNETSDDNAILFRIENIEPIRNKDGLVDKCEFILTAFNRTDEDLKEAELELSWTDTISKRYNIQEGKVVAVEDDEEAESVATQTIMLESIMAHKQKSFKSEVETDKCFSLLDSLEYEVKSCVTEGEKLEMKNSKSLSRGSCVGIFNYINSKNPEYYSEFKDVPESVLEKQVEEERKNEMEKVTNKVKSTIETLKKVDETLEQIK
ncbi:MAG: hypothetical protein MJ212_05980 [Alphaproteobacteria bacterium]|nr:hypothetical protein [Alphaproteobacteria bacterium]